MLTRLITRLEDRAAAWLERVLRNSIRLELAPFVKVTGPIHAPEVPDDEAGAKLSPLSIEGTGDASEDDRVLIRSIRERTLKRIREEQPAPLPEAPKPVMESVTFADLLNAVDAVSAPASPVTELPGLTPKQRADLKWSEHPLGLVPVNWLADRLGIPADWIREAAEERGIEQLHFSNGLRYGHAWRHWLDLWGPAKVREWLGTHGNTSDMRRYEEALKRGDR